MTKKGNYIFSEFQTNKKAELIISLCNEIIEKIKGYPTVYDRGRRDVAGKVKEMIKKQSSLKN